MSIFCTVRVLRYYHSVLYKGKVVDRTATVTGEIFPDLQRHILLTTGAHNLQIEGLVLLTI